MRTALPAVLALALLLPGVASAQKVTKETISFEGRSRTYYLFVPEAAKAAGAAKVPLLVTLHGSGRNGASLVDPWSKLAKQEGFIVAGPDAIDPQTWQGRLDGPDFLKALIDSLSARLPVDPRRIYLFGHSGGAVFALSLAMLESQYFAATAVHAGSWRRPGDSAVTQYAQRKIPIAIFSGDRDPYFSIQSVRSTRDTLREQGFPIEVTEIPRHDHDYYGIASRINRDIWAFLARQALAADPVYEQHRFAQ